jgi:hypothetical protein
VAGYVMVASAVRCRCHIDMINAVLRQGYADEYLRPPSVGDVRSSVAVSTSTPQLCMCLLSYPKRSWSVLTIARIYALIVSGISAATTLSDLLAYVGAR